MWESKGIKVLDLWIHKNQKREDIQMGFWLFFASGFIDDEIIEEEEHKTQVKWRCVLSKRRSLC